MRLAVVSDIHGNLPALEAVIAEIDRAGVDAVVDLGDIASGPLWPRETTDRLMALGWPTIAGNHERQLLDRGPHQGAADRWAAERVGDAQCEWFAALPGTLALDGGAILLVHGTPFSDHVPLLETVTPDLGRHGNPGIRAATADEVRERLGDTDARLVLCGHSHLPRVLALTSASASASGTTLVVNPGSVGLQAYDHDEPDDHRVENGSPHARWALLERGTGGWSVQWRMTVYDWAAAARRAEAAGRGDWADALLTGRVGRLEADIG